MRNKQFVSSIFNSIKETLSDFIRSHEPIDSLRVIPACCQEEFEAEMEATLEQPLVSSCDIQKGIYLIYVEHSGLRFGREMSLLDIIQRISLSIRRFYQKYGITISGQEIHIRYARNGLVIMIALNNYGRAQIATLNREQLRQLRRRAGH